MMHPTDPTTPTYRVVRDGQGAPVTCAACGCRLDMSPADQATWFHFGRFAGRDARGCRVPCVELGHDEMGLPATAVSV